MLLLYFTNGHPMSLGTMVCNGHHWGLWLGACCNGNQHPSATAPRAQVGLHQAHQSYEHRLQELDFRQSQQLHQLRQRRSDAQDPCVAKLGGCVTVSDTVEDRSTSSGGWISMAPE